MLKKRKTVYAQIFHKLYSKTHLHAFLLHNAHTDNPHMVSLAQHCPPCPRSLSDASPPLSISRTARTPPRVSLSHPIWTPHPSPISTVTHRRSGRTHLIHLRSRTHHLWSCWFASYQPLLATDLLLLIFLFSFQFDFYFYFFIFCLFSLLWDFVGLIVIDIAWPRMRFFVKGFCGFDCY